MILKEALAYLLEAYGVRYESGKVVSLATSDVPWKVGQDDGAVYEAWQAVLDRLQK